VNINNSVQVSSC